MDPSYPLFPIFAFLSFILVLIPLPWHLQASNAGTCLFMIWVAIACLNQFINSIVWHGNAIDWAPIWCDISSRLVVGIAVGIPAASLCISRRLYKITTSQAATTSYAHKRRAVLIDLAIGLGIPALQMPLQFIVQGHRYDIFEDIGCYPTTVNTPAAYPLSYIWPNAISLVSGVYSILTLRAFMIRRAQFAQFVTSNSSLTLNRYFRLMCLAMTEILITIPLSTYGLYLNITSKSSYPWKSWSDIHSNWYIIDTYPALLWRANHTSVVILEISRWSLVFSALVFFAFFGFADEARKNYRSLFNRVVGRFGFSHSNEKLGKAKVKGFMLPMSNTSSTLPVFTPKTSQPVSTAKRESFMSTTSHLSKSLTEFSDTVYGSPSPKSEYPKWPPSPASSRLSRMTL